MHFVPRQMFSFPAADIWTLTAFDGVGALRQ
jgi:hypothetical protein